jgi:ABC-type branched-subunit amino acid transport system substrate-binding protein
VTEPKKAAPPSAARKGTAGWKVTAIFVAGALIGALSVVEIVPNFTGASATTEDAASGTLEGALGGSTGDLGGNIADTGGGRKGGGKGSETADGTAAGGSTTSGGGSTGGGLAAGRPGLECSRDGNGGATDRGVSESEIKMATTVAESGLGAAFLGEVRFGMEAVKNRINSAGGVCGRQLSIEYRDDAWDAQRGSQYLRNFVQEEIFAIPVCPSSEGCRVLIDSGDLDSSQTPLIGSDGMLVDQYVTGSGAAQPWVWPVAAATVSSARIMCHNAYSKGARKFSIVFDKNYRFGVEAAEAFNSCVKKVTGKDIAGYNSQYSCQQNFCGVNGGSSSYSSDVATFQPGDFVALFLEPQTALVWMNDPNTPKGSDVKYGYGAAQPLFTRSFATNCQSKCDQMSVWTGFKPPIEGYANDSAVRSYVSDLKRTKPDADEFNAFTEGGYVGMLLLEKVLKTVGPDLTRERVQQALNSTCLASGLTIQSKICYSPTSRFANVTMQAFVIQYKGTFGGWRAGAIVKDTGA